MAGTKRGRLPGWLKTTEHGVEVDQQAAEAIRTIVDMRCNQESSYSDIARALTGVKTSGGGKWTTERIAKYLSPESRARMGGQDTPVILLSPDTLEKLDEVQTRLSERSIAPKEARPRTWDASTWLENIYCGYCDERLTAIGKTHGKHQHYCRKSVEDPSCPHPGNRHGGGGFMVATARVEEAVERVMVALAELAPHRPLLSRVLALETGDERTAGLREVALNLFTTVKVGRTESDHTAHRQIERRFVDILLTPDFAKQLGVDRAISTGLYNTHYRGKRPVTIHRNQTDD